MSSNEKLYTDAFCAWLERHGWSVHLRESNAPLAEDAYATRGEERLWVEVKGLPVQPGTKVDELYGQLLRRMKTDDANTRYAAVVPDQDRVVRAAQRLPGWICDRLRIDIYAVAQDGSVRLVSPRERGKADMATALKEHPAAEPDE